MLLKIDANYRLEKFFIYVVFFKKHLLQNSTIKIVNVAQYVID